MKLRLKVCDQVDSIITQLYVMKIEILTSEESILLIIVMTFWF